MYPRLAKTDPAHLHDEIGQKSENCCCCCQRNHEMARELISAKERTVGTETLCRRMHLPVPPSFPSDGSLFPVGQETSRKPPFGVFEAAQALGTAARGASMTPLVAGAIARRETHHRRCAGGSRQSLAYARCAELHSRSRVPWHVRCLSFMPVTHLNAYVHLRCGSLSLAIALSVNVVQPLPAELFQALEDRADAIEGARTSANTKVISLRVPAAYVKGATHDWYLLTSSAPHTDLSKALGSPKVRQHGLDPTV